jgi:hypothetical protein
MDRIMTKYYERPFVSIDEMEDDFRNIELTGIPSVDFTFISIIVKYFNDNAQHAVWEEYGDEFVTYVYDSIVIILEELKINVADLKISKDIISLVIKRSVHMGDDPRYTNIKVVGLMDTVLKKYYVKDQTNKEQEVEYIKARLMVSKKLFNIAMSYKQQYKNIKTKFNSIINRIIENLKLENDPKYIGAIHLMETIDEEASLEIESLLDTVSKSIEEEFIKNPDVFIEKKKKILGEFKIEMDKIYDTVIKSKSKEFRDPENPVFKMLSSSFENDKSFYMLLINLEVSIKFLSSSIKKM